MFGKRKPWCPESISKVLLNLPAEFNFRLYDSNAGVIPFIDFRERRVHAFGVRFSDTQIQKVFYLPQGRIAPEWCQQVIEGIQDFIASNDFLSSEEAQALGLEIISRLQLGKEAQTLDARFLSLSLGRYPLVQRRRILQFLLELDEDTPWSIVQLNLYNIRAEEAQRVRTAMDIMEATHA